MQLLRGGDEAASSSLMPSVHEYRVVEATVSLLWRLRLNGRKEPNVTTVVKLMCLEMISLSVGGGAFC